MIRECRRWMLVDHAGFWSEGFVPTVVMSTLKLSGEKEDEAGSSYLMPALSYGTIPPENIGKVVDWTGPSCSSDAGGDTWYSNFYQQNNFENLADKL